MGAQPQSRPFDVACIAPSLLALLCSASALCSLRLSTYDFSDPLIVPMVSLLLADLAGCRVAFSRILRHIDRPPVALPIIRASLSTLLAVSTKGRCATGSLAPQTSKDCPRD